MTQGSRVDQLETDLQIEREAHESTLRDAEATLLELEGIRSMDTGQPEALSSLQEDLWREKQARQKAEVRFIISFIAELLCKKY